MRRQHRKAAVYRVFSDDEKEWIRENIKYDPATGDFWRKITSSPRPGSARVSYAIFSMFNEQFLAHRVAWFLMTGEYPTGIIDHINRDRRDNRWSNLRAADKSQNGANRTWRKSNNQTGFRGVRFTRSGKYSAQITFRKQSIYLGTFETADAAHSAYQSKGAELFGDYFNCHVDP